MRYRQTLCVLCRQIGFLTLAMVLAEFCHARSPLDQGNDGCPATVISSLPYSDSGTTTGLTQDAPSPGCPVSGPDVLYQLVATASTSHTFSLCGSSFDCGLVIRTGGPCPGTTEIACNDDFCGTNSQITLLLNSGQTYWIVVNGYGGGSGNYTLAVSSQVAVNDCPGHLISAIPFTDTGNTCIETNDFINCVGTTSQDTVYRYTPAVSGEITVSLCNSTFDTALEVRMDGNCPGDTPLACNDDNGPACAGLPSSIQFAATAGTTYYFIVHGYANSCGDYSLYVGRPPSAGRCCYNNGNSCSQGITQAECEEQLFGQFDPDLDCSTPCPCVSATELRIGPSSGAGAQLTWLTHSNGEDQVWSTTYYNNDGNPNGGLDTMWTMRYSIAVSPGAQSWIDTGISSNRYRNYVVVHICP